jgi:Na+-transporting NADH:ubiquinone oxidoreductase subunit A
MRQISIEKGLDIPIGGKPSHTVTSSRPVSHVALMGDDYPDMKPTMRVNVGEHVACGQPLFSDKKNDDINFTAPGSGEVIAIHRGPKRKFESLVIRLEGDDAVSFCAPESKPDGLGPQEIRTLLIDSGLWCSLRSRPYGKIPAINDAPAALFVTAIDTSPLGPDMEGIIALAEADFLSGVKALTVCVDAQVYLCQDAGQKIVQVEIPGVEQVAFAGPHPAGLPSTHIHFLDPVHENKTAWHIGAQDVIAIGALLRTGTLQTERILSLAGPGIKEPRHIRTRLGASISELCDKELIEEEVRILSGSVLDGRQVDDMHDFLGRYHQQISSLPEGDGRQFFGWLRPGSDRFSITKAFSSSFKKPAILPFDTAVWGGNRAIFPLGTYEKVMPLDIVPIYLLKSLASGNSQKAKELGCLELVEEDLALCSYVCPGKNNFGPMLRETLSTIEKEG